MTDNSFGKEFRLLSARDFQDLRKDSRTINSKWIRCIFKKNTKNPSVSRLGLAVSRKVGDANVRNRNKRILREYFRKSELKYIGQDILLIVSQRLHKTLKDPLLAEKELLESIGNIEKKLLGSNK